MTLTGRSTFYKFSDSEEYEVHTVYSFPYLKFRDYEKVTRGKRSYYNIACAFDIETSSLYCRRRKTCPLMKRGKCTMDKCKYWVTPSAWMYVWQACIDNEIVMGRTWEEFRYFLGQLQNYLGLTERKILPVYVHNLPFEFQFMRNEITWINVFARQKRQPLKALCEYGVEFRCSYRLSNKSLEKFIEQFPTIKLGKLTGQLDYEQIRFSDTKMKPEEIHYCIRDVYAVCLALKELMKTDNMATIPLTSTGYVRRDCREAVLSNPKNRNIFRRTALSVDQYNMCRLAFRGGDTHANYLWADQTLKNVKSRDIASSYPYQLMTKKFPMKFVRGDVKKLNRYINDGLACLFMVRMEDVEYIGKNMPYLSSSKCKSDINLGSNKPKEWKYDNGRIISAKTVITTLTEIDWQIIRRDYKIGRYQVRNLYIAKKEYIYNELRCKIMEYFTGKCTLKGRDPYNYAKKKNELNSIYGMMVTDIVAPSVSYENGNWTESPVDITEELQNYYNNRRSFLPYQWGVWVTAYARQQLHSILEICGIDAYYCDTDSCKYSDVDGKIEGKIKKLNDKLRAESESAPIPPKVIYNGKEYQMGQFEEDGVYDEFRTLGSKKYIVNENGKIKTTVAGLGREAGANYFKDHSISEFRKGLVFYPSGRLNAFYFDEPVNVSRETLRRCCVDHSGLIVRSGMSLVPGTYILGITEEYEQLLNERSL